MEKTLYFQDETRFDTIPYKGKLLDADLCEVAYHAHYDYHWKDKELLNLLVDVKGLDRGEAKLVLELAKNFSRYIEARRAEQ